MKRAIGIIALAALSACASEIEDGTGGAAGAGGNVGTAGKSPTEGPYITVREDADDLVYFFPEAIDDETTWPSLVWFNSASGYTKGFNYNGLLDLIELT